MELGRLNCSRTSRSTNTSLLSWKAERLSCRQVRVLLVWHSYWARNKKSRSTRMALTTHDESRPPGIGRPMISPRRTEHIFLCSWPETQESVVIPFVKIMILWLGGIALHCVSIAAAPKTWTSQRITCFTIPWSIWWRMLGVMERKISTSRRHSQNEWYTGFSPALWQARWNVVALPSANR